MCHLVSPKWPETAADKDLFWQAEESMRIETLQEILSDSRVSPSVRLLLVAEKMENWEDADQEFYYIDKMLGSDIEWTDEAKQRLANMKKLWQLRMLAPPPLKVVGRPATAVAGQHAFQAGVRQSVYASRDAAAVTRVNNAPEPFAGAASSSGTADADRHADKKARIIAENKAAALAKRKAKEIQAVFEAMQWLP